MGRPAEKHRLLRRSPPRVVIRNAKDIGPFVKAARRYAGTCSSGEFRLLLAICTLVDFGHLVDDLAGGKAWQELVMGCDRRFRAAIAACVMEAP